MIFPRPLVVILFVGTILLVGGGAGCSMLTGAESDRDRRIEYLVAQVDSVDVPAQIAPTDTLKIGMKGTVGPNTCYEFERFDVARSTGQLTVTPIVAHTIADDPPCAMVVIPLDRTFTVGPTFAAGMLTVAVPQPDQPDVTATVEVANWRQSARRK